MAFLAIGTAFLLLVAVGVSLAPQAAVPAQSQIPGNKIVARALDIDLGRSAPAPHEAKLSSGVVYAALEGTGELDRRADDAARRGIVPPSLRSVPFTTQGCPNVLVGPVRDIRVNQDCSLRRQAEEVIAVNPTNSQNLIAGQNDSRLGFNKCGYDWSFDGGRTWGDQIPPFYQFIMGDSHTADACSDPTVTFDADGNAYAGGILFQLNSPASAFVVAKSNAGIGGAFYHSPAPVAFQTTRDTPLGVIASDNDPNIFHDKEFIVADASNSSVKRNNVYATWTRFNGSTGAGVGGNSPIYFSQSTNGGATWSTGVEISGANAAACVASSGEANSAACDQDQGSHPVVGPDGTIYVAFGNGNTPTNGVNQHMLVSCPPSADCSSSANWTAPVKISDDIGTQPIGPDAKTGCPGGRQCLPPNGYRMDDFIEGSVSVDAANNLYFVWGDFRNAGSSCSWNGGTAGSAATVVGPCNNDVFFSVSKDRGKTWSAANNVTPASRFGQTAQWMPWSAVTADGSVLWVAYYDRSYGNCEATGCNDITLARVGNPGSASPTYSYTRLTTSSMPNLLPSNNPFQAGFLGDYMWVTVDSGGHPYVVWADTRGRSGAVEEDIYFAGLP